MFTKLLIMALVFCAGSMVFGKTVTPLKITKAPKLDGKLDEPFWKQAKSMGDFYIFKQDEEKTQDTEVKIAYDNSWLYFGFICKNEKLNMLTPKVQGRAEEAHTDDSVEIFIDPGNTGKNYLQYKLSYAGAKGESRTVNKQSNTAWDEPWLAAVDVQPNSWSAEMAIPLYVLFSESGAGPWTINICRNKLVLELDQYMVILSESREHSSLARVKRKFHEPENFAPLAKLDVEKTQTPLMAILRDVKIYPYRTENGKKMFDVQIAARGANAQTGELNAEIITYPVSGKATRTAQKFTQTGTKLSRVKVSVPVEKFVDRDIEVILRNPTLNGVVDRIVLEAPKELSVMTAYLGRNYYTSEKDAVFAVFLSLPPAVLKNMKLVVFSGKNRLAVCEDCSKKNQVKFPINSLKSGKTPIRIELQQKDGTVFFAKKLSLLKRKPNPGCEWKIDKINQVVLNNGKSFFPVGIVTTRARNKKQWEETIQLYKKMGFNTILINSGWLEPQDLPEYCRMAAKENIFLVLKPTSVAKRLRDLSQAVKDLKKLIPGEDAKSREDRRVLSVTSFTGVKYKLFRISEQRNWNKKQRMECIDIAYRNNLPIMMKGVEAVKNSPNLMAYYTVDEPTSSIDQYKLIDAFYDEIYKVDGYHPVMPIFAQYVHQGKKWLNGADIACVDCYWTPEGDASFSSTPNYVASLTSRVVERCEKNRKVPWLMPCAENWSGIGRGKRTYTPAEHYCQALIEIIHGAKGIIWFADPLYESNRKALKNVADMMKIITPMATAPTVKQKIKYFLTSESEKEDIQEVFYRPKKRQFPDVQCRIFRDPANGKFVLLVTNSRYYPVTAEFKVSGLKNTRVKTIFKGTELPATDGVFKEKLEPFAVRAYVLGVIKEPVSLSVTSCRPEEIPPPSVMFKGNVRMDRKNVMPNPSFEDETVPGVTDYYMGGGELVKGDAKFGHKCLKLAPYNKNYAQVGFNRAPFEKQETPYTFSIWLKGEKGGEEVEFKRLWNPDKRTFKVTPEWKRYSFPVTIPKRMTKHAADAYWYICNWANAKTGGAVFMDGIQLEKGTKVTDFED